MIRSSNKNKKSIDRRGKLLRRNYIAQWLLAGLAAVVLFAGGNFAHAQQITGSIIGKVADEQGALVTNATITATNDATGFTRTAKTDDAGAFNIQFLPVGGYTVTVEAQGFKQTFQNGVVLHVGNNIRQDISLELGDESQSVTVEATAGLMQVESAEIKDGIENQQIVNCR